MKLAVAHYHLNPGGVTQVILNQILALDRSTDEVPPEILVLHGGRTEGWPQDFERQLAHVRLRQAAVEGLDYDSGALAIEPLFARFRAALIEHGMGPHETTLLIHNPTLGKNVSLPGVVTKLADAGYHCLCQIHDFAEDFRPENYVRLEKAWGGGMERLYPQASSVHYAALTGRDTQVLIEAGIQPNRVHCLPNPVIATPPQADREAARQQLHQQFGIDPHDHLFLYPVRGIRRKNLGEAVLWATLAGRGHAVAVTLPPKNPVELYAYRRWQRFAARHAVPCVFDVGASGALDFEQNLVAADTMLTTSVAEGFGMVFLETWLRGKRLVGRNLPGVTADFVAAGVQLNDLYDDLRIPLDAIDAQLVRAELRACFDQVLIEYGRQPTQDADAAAAWAELTSRGTIDFAYLTVATQRRLIARAVEDPALRERLLATNPAIARVLQSRSQTPIEPNATSVQESYSPQATGAALRRALEAVERSHHESARGLPGYAAVLNTFLQPKKCHPLRMDPIAPDPSRLSEIIRNQSTPMSPIPTGEKQQLRRLGEIQAVVFDIYGTMLISGSGDIGVATPEAHDPRDVAFEAAWSKAELGTYPAGFSGPTRLVETVRRHHEAAQRIGVDYPEVDIIEVWEEVLGTLIRPPSVDQLAILATEYEVLVNPVWPMPELLETLAALRGLGVRLGIVSNAQFFTPTAFPALCHQSLEQLGFEPRLCCFSYEALVAKPSLAMFKQVTSGLQNLGIAPEKTLYVGNDMRNDVMPAAKLGMRTALFAGDQRSLRWRAGEALVAGIAPDLVLTELGQLVECLGSSSSAPLVPAD